MEGLRQPDAPGIVREIRVVDRSAIQRSDRGTISDYTTAVSRTMLGRLPVVVHASRLHHKDLAKPNGLSRAGGF
jgi:hypothetical protein